jgi:hypothetical protein
MARETHECRAKELEVYEAMLTLSQRQRDAILGADWNGLERATREKEKLIVQATQLGARVAALIDECALATGVRNHECLARAGAEVGSCLLNAKIARVLSELLTFENSNQELLESAMEPVREELKAVRTGKRALRAYWGQPAVRAHGLIDGDA